MTAVAAAAVASRSAAAAEARAFPTKPIRMIVPFAAGGNGDVVARIFSERAGRELGQPVVVENLTGANGVIGTQAAIRAKPDGYTMVHTGTGTIVLPMMQRETYDWKHGLTPVIGVGSIPLLFVVNGKSGIRSLSDLSAVAKASPAGINYGSGGPGTGQLAPARLLAELKINGTHVPYRGFSAAIQALLSGQVQLVCATTTDVLELVRAGHLRVLGVAAERRLPDLPDAPTMVEQGFADFLMETWSAYLVPANTPRDIIGRLYQAYAEAARDPAVLQKLGKLGFQVRVRTPGETGKFMRDEAARWRRVIVDNNLKFDN